MPGLSTDHLRLNAQTNNCLKLRMVPKQHRGTLRQNTPANTKGTDTNVRMSQGCNRIMFHRNKIPDQL